MCSTLSEARIELPISKRSLRIHTVSMSTHASVRPAAVQSSSPSGKSSETSDDHTGEARSTPTVAARMRRRRGTKRGVPSAAAIAATEGGGRQIGRQSQQPSLPKKSKRKRNRASELSPAEADAFTQMSQLSEQHTTWVNGLTALYSLEVCQHIEDLHNHLLSVRNDFGDVLAPPSTAILEDRRMEGALTCEARRGLIFFGKLYDLMKEFPKATDKFGLLE
jgi:hypothetical protein